MPAAFLPSPASSVWHLGPVPLRAFSLCMVAGVLAGLWLTDWRYRRAGGQEGVILAVATVAVPVGLVGARVYSVVSNAHLYFGHGRDWVDVLRFWNGGLGVAGAVAAGALAAWAYCRHAGIELGPLALAAAPALPVGQAIAVWGNWFTQSLYGRPSALPWAVAITPLHRAVGYQTFATFQPIFVYESALYLLVAAAVAYGIHRFHLTGDMAFALYAGLYATARFCAEAQRVDYSPRLLGFRTDEAAMFAILLVAWSYMLVMRGRRYRRPLLFAGAMSRRSSLALRPRSDSGKADARAHLARFAGSADRIRLARAVRWPRPARSTRPAPSGPRLTPATPATPDAPATPDLPASPGAPATPDLPASPGAPATPDLPASPDAPATPDATATPSTPPTPATPGGAGAGTDKPDGRGEAVGPAEPPEPPESSAASAPAELAEPATPEEYGSRWQVPERPPPSPRVPAQPATGQALTSRPAGSNPVTLGPADGP
jgi:prolipoprotein diacylglyceryl transferase